MWTRPSAMTTLPSHSCILAEALSLTLKMLAMGFIRSPKASGIRLIVHSKAERLTRLAISFTPTVMQMAFPTRNNTTNITSTRIVENPMYRLKPLMEKRIWGQNKCLRKQEIFIIR
jgi:hypothetical protein